MIGMHAFLDMPVYVLHHDDRIIHHQSNGDHQGQQGQQIDGKSHQPDQEQDTYQGQRNCHQRDQYHPRRSQEYKNDQHHDDRGFYQGQRHFLEGFLDKDRSIGVEKHFQVRWHLCRQSWHYSLDPFRNFQGIGTRCGGDRQEHGIPSAGKGGGIIVGCRQFQLRHVTQQDPLFALLAHDDVFKILGSLHIRFCIDTGADQVSAGGAGGGYVVLFADGVVYVSGGDAKGRHAGRVQPHPHSELPATQYRGLADALQGTEFRLNGAVQVVDDLLDGHLLGEEGQVHHCVVTEAVGHDRVFHFPG